MTLAAIVVMTIFWYRLFICNTMKIGWLIIVNRLIIVYLVLYGFDGGWNRTYILVNYRIFISTGF